jgi:hypothetical protein
METKQKLPVEYTDRVELTIPEFNSTRSIKLDITKIKNGESRFLEARIVNGATYNDLEHCFNEGYRQARTHLSLIGYQITRAKKAQRECKSVYLIDHYKEFLKETKLKDSAAIRDAFLETKEDYVEALDRIDLLTALESLMEGKIKNFENVCRYMRKTMDTINRSGIDPNKYIR